MQVGRRIWSVGCTASHVQSLWSRAYATAPKPKQVKIKEPKLLPYQQTRKELSDRKSHLFSKYQRLLRENELIILFQSENLSVALLEKVRKQVHSVPFPDADKFRLNSMEQGQWTLPPIALDVARTGLLRPICRQDPAACIQGLQPYLSGQVALLSTPVLSPEYIGKVLRAMERPVKAARDAVDSTSGKKAPSLLPVAAIVERSRLVDASSIPALTKLPSLPVLQSQLVGLLSMPGQQIAGILSQGGGGVLAATLAARRRDLENGQDAA
ncbi:hypothetical protein MYAM1_003090 [Malassezia yamatoensis]|uniref:Uncharacterized protein n=1 Tax=Malassezia yamatoensis TaxID=253288 RepID=A0AAJ5YX44_9BASI|nr:hypothetical protein MYAM1_003090 [Malassezia yamatoensis]